MRVVALCHIVFTNLYDCAHVALADENENQNCADAAVILHPMDASCRGVEAISSRVEEEAGYDHYRTEVVAAIYGGRTVEVNAAVTWAVAGNRRSRTCPRKPGGDVTPAAVTAAEVTTICRREAVDVD